MAGVTLNEELIMKWSQLISMRYFILRLEWLTGTITYLRQRWYLGRLELENTWIQKYHIAKSIHFDVWYRWYSFNWFNSIYTHVSVLFHIKRAFNGIISKVPCAVMSFILCWLYCSCSAQLG
jgi:hypothetical protein